ncbi:MAG: hypothetical protein ACRYHQ_38110 [Janthinobacterium lividum]
MLAWGQLLVTAGDADVASASQLGHQLGVWTATATAVAQRPSPCLRNASAITCCDLFMAAPARTPMRERIEAFNQARRSGVAVQRRG